MSAKTLYDTDRFDPYITFCTMTQEMDEQSRCIEVDGNLIVDTGRHRWIWSCYRGDHKMNCELKHVHDNYELCVWICSKHLGFTHNTKIYVQPERVNWNVTVTSNTA